MSRSKFLGLALVSTTIFTFIFFVARSEQYGVGNWHYAQQVDYYHDHAHATDDLSAGNSTLGVCNNLVLSSPMTGFSTPNLII